MAAESLIGNLAVLLTMETAAFEKGTTHASKLLKKTQRDIEATAAKVAGVGQKMSLAITAPLVGFGAVALKEAGEARAAMAQVNSALASMGPVAGRNAKQLKEMSDALELNSLYEGDEILRKVTANLLTFGNISGKAFDQAQQAALNLSARMGTDLQASALMVGKALNDPIKGMAALGRAGVQFSAGQKEAIKSLVETGQIAQAQTIILGELERQFGGAAKAAQDADPYNKATDAFKQMAETVGNALLPLIPPLTNAIVSVANAFGSLSPTMQKWIIIGAGVAAAIGPIAVGLGGLISAFGLLLPLLIKIGPAWTALSTALAAARVAAIAALPALAPLLIPLAAITAAVVAGYLAWKNWDKIAPIVQRMASGVTAALNRLAAPFKWVQDKAKQVGDAFFKLYDRVVGHSYIPDMVDGIAKELARLDGVLVQPAKKATAETAKHFEALRTLLARLFPEAERKNEYLADLAELDRALKQGKLSAEMYAEALERLKVDKGQVTNDTVELESRGNSGDPSNNFGDTFGTAADNLSRIPDLAAQANEAMRRVAEDGIDSLAGGLTNVLMGAEKLGDMFRRVAQDILAQIIKIQIQTMLIKLGSSLGLFPGLAGARASGGPVTGGRTYLVGEKGPELFMPGRSGQIVPNHALAGAGGGTFNFNFPGVTNAREARQAGLQAAAAYKGSMARATRAGF